jgi:putative membrane protein
MITIPQKRLVVQTIAVTGGLALLGFLARDIGISEVIAHLHQIGWWAPLLFLPAVGIALCDAQGWACAFPPAAQIQKVPLWRLSLARLAGEAINNLTPTATIGGEPVKVYLLRAHGITTETGLTSVVIAKTALTVSQIVFILLGILFFLLRLGWLRHSWWVLGLLMVLAYGFVLVLIRWQRQGLMSMVVRVVRRLVPRWKRLAQWEEGARRVDAHLLGYYNGNSREFVSSAVYHFFGWLFGAVEVLCFFYLMEVKITPIDALIIEALIQPLAAAALIIPGALGVREAGGVFLCRLLGLDGGAGLALMALKRVREAVFDLIGLSVLARSGGALLPWKRAHSL